ENKVFIISQIRFQQTLVQRQKYIIQNLITLFALFPFRPKEGKLFAHHSAADGLFLITYFTTKVFII
ncbi:MAG: hypothetical protein Q7W54_04110, partial [Bacteroidota bacterium]|nr:hypothetical protein [Bacteroidota bacterium]